jgi:hypothetical protein
LILLIIELSTAPDSENNLMVFVDGVFQAQNVYSVSGTTLTFATAPANGRVITVYHSTTTVGGSNNSIATMTGDGSDTTLTLSVAPVHENNVSVFFDGVYQSKSNYSISGTTLTFSTAPASGVAVEAITATNTSITTATQLVDADSDTMIQVEESSDEDKIRFDTGGTERMIIDGTSVGIGTSTPGSLNANANNLVVGSGSGGEGITIYSANDNNAQIFFADGTSGDAQYRGVVRYAHDVDRFEFFTSGAIKAVLDSSGNLGIGTSTPGSFDSEANNLVVGSGSGDQGITIFTGSSVGDHGSIFFADATGSPKQGQIRYEQNNEVMSFFTNATERMRIGSGVNVGSTSGASAGGVSAYVADNDTAFYANGSNGRVNIKIHTEATGGKIWYLRTGGTAHFGSGGGDFMVLNEEGSAIMTWDYSASTINGDFNDTSDVGLKENIADITDAITTIKALKPRTFDWKEKTKLQGTHGFIAQEVETVLPNDVVGENYDANNPEHGSKSLNTSGLLAVAVKAIQEQQTIIEDLKTRIETLEG